MLVSICYFPSALLPTFHIFSFNFPIPQWGRALAIPSVQEVKAQEGKSRLLSPHSSSAVGLGSSPHRLTLDPAPSPSTLPPLHNHQAPDPPPTTPTAPTAPTTAPPPLPTPKILLALSSGVRHDRDECGISVSYDHFFSTLRFFLEQSDWFPQPEYWFCNYRNEASCHLSAWLLPKICFQFLDWISSLFFLECLKAMFLTLKKKIKTPASSIICFTPAARRVWAGIPFCGS